MPASQTDQPAIERNVPIPSRDGQYSKYPFKELQIGDSFLALPGGERSMESFVLNFRQSMQYAQRKLNIKICSRKQEGGVRVWRIA